MLNEADNYIKMKKLFYGKKLLRSFLLMSILVLFGCGPSKERLAAESLLNEAQSQLDSGNFQQAFKLLDSISVAYPKETEIRKQAMFLRTSVIEAETLKEISYNDSMSAEMKILYDQVLPRMKKVENPQLVEGYWIAIDGNDPKFMESTGIQARVSEDGEFYVISEVNGANNLHHSSFSLSTPSGVKAHSDTVPFDNELNYRINNSETVTYSGENTDSVGRFAVKYVNDPIKLIFIGEDGKTKTVNLKTDQVQAIADAYLMASSLTKGKRLSAQRELLERKLQLARDQKARTLPDQSK